MITATAKATFREDNGKVIVELYVNRTSEELFNMGNSSFLINYTGLINPVVTFKNETYSGGEYDEMEFKNIYNRTLGVQLRVKNKGVIVSDIPTKIFSIELEKASDKYDFTWRLIDTAIVTPDFQTVVTDYLMQDISNSPGYMGKSLQELVEEYNQTIPPKFTYQGIILNGAFDVLPVPYSPMQYFNGKYNVFLLRNGNFCIASSSNGLNNWTYTNSGFPYGSVMKDTLYFLCAYHKWFNNQSYFYFSASADGVNFTDVSTIRTPHGEDISFIKLRNGKFRAYGRMNVPPALRTIGVMESDDFRNWTPLQEILVPDASDNGKEFYSCSVIETDNGFYAFINVYNPRNEQVTVRLMKSENGITAWKRLNGFNPVIKLGDRQQIYASASVIGNEVYVTTISAKFNHSESNRNGKYYYTELWKIGIDDLYRFN